ncbi:uncharacterized protein C1orf185 homolog [Psammomys obesus]|uniref:uncharacterized protein C1orf185 homolog n=1 Tax=Psammomys obesus TaxID=48139 RepID=UPI002453431A|nr:uncharacterized protein C1orf185 homolog [Psammomys obesus]
MEALSACDFYSFSENHCPPQQLEERASGSVYDIIAFRFFWPELCYKASANGFLNLLTYFLAAGAVSLGIGFFALASALWFLIYKRRELLQSPKFKLIDETLKQGLSKPKFNSHSQCVFISRNFHAGLSQTQVEQRERDEAQTEGEGHPRNELCLLDLVSYESPEMTSIANSSSMTLSFSTSVSSSYYSQSLEAADEWFSDDSLEAKKPPKPLIGEPLAEKVLAYLSTISIEEWPGNTMNMMFCSDQKDDSSKEHFLQRNTEIGKLNLQCDIE